MRQWIFIAIAVMFSGISTAYASAAGTVFPSSKGSTWHYRYSTGGSYSVTIVSSTPTGFTEKQHGRVHAKMRFKKTAAGWVSGDVGHSNKFQMQGRKITVTIVHTSGVVVPKTSLWKPGYKWSFSSTDLSRVAMHQVVIMARTRVASASKITGVRKIKVPAGKFICYRVRTIENIRTSVKVGKASRVQHAKIKIIDYYAKGVGLVERKAYHTTTELTHYHIQ